MTSPQRTCLILVAAAALLWLGAIAILDYCVDPFCYRCADIPVGKPTRNYYLHAAQRARAHPEGRQIILGTSRGERVPVEWLEERTHLPTVNLSAPASDVFVKIALLRAAEASMPLESIIWVSDYFEFFDGITIKRFVQSPALQRYIPDLLPGSPLFRSLERWSFLIDHNTLEASLASFKDPGQPSLSKSIIPCLPAAATPPDEALLDAIGAAYTTYAEGVFLRERSPEAWKAFAGELAKLSRQGKRVLILAPPYHPYFRERFRRNHPRHYQKQLEWARQLATLQNDHVRVASFLDGLPDDDPGRRNWHDGDHFTCQAAIDMLTRAGI